MFCKKCGQPIGGNAVTCANCGEHPAGPPNDVSRKSNTRTVIIVISAIIISILIFPTMLLVSGYFMFRRAANSMNNNISDIMKNETRFACSKATVLGQYLAQKYPGKKVLIICNQGFEKNKRTQKIINALRQAVCSEANADTIKVKAPTKDMLDHNGNLVIPLEEVMTPADFDAAVTAHPDCQVIVSMIGLPREKAKMKFWNDKNKHLAMLNANIFDQKNDIKAGRIVAAVSFKPGVKFTEDPAPADPRKAFDKRYLLITPDNIGHLKKEYPNLFK